MGAVALRLFMRVCFKGIHEIAPCLAGFATCVALLGLIFLQNKNRPAAKRW